MDQALDGNPINEILDENLDTSKRPKKLSRELGKKLNHPNPQIKPRSELISWDSTGASAAEAKPCKAWARIWSPPIINVHSEATALAASEEVSPDMVVLWKKWNIPSMWFTCQKIETYHLCVLNTKNV